ncbi:hypothetical protein LIER_14945 [Lithospermum erythrorhizon]|uniref:Retrovirus-related Pol polyprotein from transposon TNT 1-94-like beta-barrel domain-containing protein n=1 Tax=Lithospermum erythrorhizon TaxID=34254 RepID=A0AAV3Q0Z7_LITER
MTALEASDKLGFITGEIEVPAIDNQLHKCLNRMLVNCGMKLGKVLDLKYDKDDEERVIQFLMGLNDEYEAIRNQILLMDPLPFVSKYKSMVVNVENQRQVQHFAHEVVENFVMQVRNYQPTGDVYQPAASKYIMVDKSQLKCDNCEKRGHVKAGCFKLKGYPNWWPNVVSIHFTDLSGSSFSFRANSTFMKKYDSWIVDSGASTHMCCDIAIFDSLQNAKQFEHVHLPDNSTITVKSIGIVQLPANLKLVDCLYVSSFKCNLLYVSKIVKTSSVRFSFFANHYLL